MLYIHVEMFSIMIVLSVLYYEQPLEDLRFLLFFLFYFFLILNIYTGREHTGDSLFERYLYINARSLVQSILFYFIVFISRIPRLRRIFVQRREGKGHSQSKRADVSDEIFRI